MKFRSFFSLVATMIITTGAMGSAEIYNKDGSTLSIFGNISGGHYFSKNYMNNGGNAFVRYGLTGKTYLNDKIMGFGVWEQELPLNNVEEGVNLKDNGRSLVGYVGIKLGELGSIDYGRNYGVLYDVISWTDLTPELGGDISVSDNFLYGRASNVVTYRNENLFSFLDGFNFAVQYQGKNDVGCHTGRTVKTANGEGYGVSASYKLKNGIAASAAYSNSKRTAEQKGLDGTYVSDNVEAYSVGLKYNAYGLYIAATYGETYNMTPFGNFYDTLNTDDSIYGFVNKAINVGVVAKYRFDCGFIPLVSYVHSKASDIDNGYSNYLKKCVTVGTTYLINKNVAAVIDYRINLLTKNDFSTSAKICTDDILALGISYLF